MNQSKSLDAILLSEGAVLLSEGAVLLSEGGCQFGIFYSSVKRCVGIMH